MLSRRNLPPHLWWGRVSPKMYWFFGFTGKGLFLVLFWVFVCGLLVVGFWGFSTFGAGSPPLVVGFTLLCRVVGLVGSIHVVNWWWFGGGGWFWVTTVGGGVTLRRRVGCFWLKRVKPLCGLGVVWGSNHVVVWGVAEWYSHLRWLSQRCQYEVMY